ncbi:MAG: SDR family oxidoreductase [Steroidobacteraceae bacterium]
MPGLATTRRTLVFCAAALVMLAGACAGGTGAGPARATPLVLVVGATGGTGREVVRLALARGYAVRAFVRDEAKARTLFGDRVGYVVGDVRDTAALPAAVAGADYIVSALGSNSRRDPTNRPEVIDFGAVKALAEAARAADVRHFVLVSSMGVTDPDHILNRMFDNVLLWKKQGEDAVRASGVPYTIVRPGGLRDGPAGEGGVQVMQGDPKMPGPVARAALAAILVAALGRRDALSKTFEVVGDPDGSPPDWDHFFAALQADGSRP